MKEPPGREARGFSPSREGSHHANVRRLITSNESYEDTFLKSRAGAVATRCTTLRFLRLMTHQLPRFRAI